MFDFASRSAALLAGGIILAGLAFAPPALAQNANKKSQANVTAQCNQMARSRFPDPEQTRDRSTFVKACRANGGRM